MWHLNRVSVASYSKLLLTFILVISAPRSSWATKSTCENAVKGASTSSQSTLDTNEIAEPPLLSPTELGEVIKNLDDELINLENNLSESESTDLEHRFMKDLAQPSPDRPEASVDSTPLHSTKLSRLKKLFLKFRSASQRAIEGTKKLSSVLSLALQPANFSSPLSEWLSKKDFHWGRWLKGPFRTLDIGFYGLKQFFNPIPFYNSKTEKQFFSPHFDPHYDDHPNTMKPQIEFNKKHPYWLGFRFMVNQTFKSLFLASFIFTNLHLQQVTSQIIGPQEYLHQPQVSWQYMNRNNPQTLQGDLPVDILIDIGPYSHLAMQFNGRVYSFSFKRLLISKSVQYINEELFENFNPNEMQAQKDGHPLYPRVIQVLRLNLKASSVIQMIEQLESLATSSYPNEKGINDCATMLVRLLNDYTELHLPKMVNASPSQVGFVLSGYKITNQKNSNGNPLVTDTFTIAVGDPSQPNVAIAKSALNNYFESNAFVTSILPLSLAKEVFNAVVTPDRLIYLDPEIDVSYRQFKNEGAKKFEEAFKTDPVYSDLFGLLKSDQATASEKMEVQKLLKSTLQAERRRIEELTQATAIPREMRETYEGQLNAISKIDSELMESPQ